MDLRRLYEELARAAERAGVGVRVDAFDPQLSDVKRPRGGLCRLRGKLVIVVDVALPLPERIATLAGGLAAIDLEHLYLPPIVRATIGAYQGLAPGALLEAPRAAAGVRERVPALARTRRLL